MDSWTMAVLNWAKDVLNGFDDKVIILIIALSAVSLFIHFKK